MFNNSLQVSVFLNQLKRRLRTNSFNGFQIVTAEENTKFNELKKKNKNGHRNKTDPHLIHIHFKAVKGGLQINFTYWLFLGLRERQMSEKDRRFECQGVHVF